MDAVYESIVRVRTEEFEVSTNHSVVVVSANLLQKRTALFCLRIALALVIMLVAVTFMLSGSPLLFVIGVVIQGAMYVHLIEFQHSVLHLQVFESHKLTRIVGFLLGLPMMISFSDFQYRHLRHHKFLGTEMNSETFSYQRDQLNSVSGFLQATLDYSRLRTLLTRIYRAYTGQKMLSDSDYNPVMDARISQEYKLFGLALVAAIAVSIYLQNTWILVLWLMPLIASEPVHFLLELPEHIGLPAHSNVNVFENTRTWGGSWFARWFTHYTNFHIAHHFNQMVPMDNLPELQKLLDPHIPESSRCESYPDCYMKIINGEIRP